MPQKVYFCTKTKKVMFFYVIHFDAPFAFGGKEGSGGFCSG